MEEFANQLHNIRDMSAANKLISIVDILLVAYLIYRLLMIIRGTRVWRFVAGVLGFLIIYWMSGWLHLTTLNWLMERVTYLGPAALVFLFLPELRAAVEDFGRPSAKLLQRLVPVSHEETAEAHTIEEIVAAVAEMSAGRVGALIVIERKASLEEFVSNGVLLRSLISAPLLGSIFFENNPLHDGAVIVRGDLIISAASRLPLSESRHLDPTVHMRHRAAVGISESFDCLSVVVSEERGTISIASDGRLQRLASPGELRTLLNKELRHIEDGVKPEKKLLERRKKTGATP